jgi:hypothetical protein
MGCVLILPLSMSCPYPYNKPFSVFIMPLHWHLGAGKWTWHMESQEFGPCVQNSGFSFGEPAMRKCTFRGSHPHLDGFGWGGKMKSVPGSWWNYIYLKDFFSCFHFSQCQLPFFFWPPLGEVEYWVPKLYNKTPFSAFTTPLYLVFRGGCSRLAHGISEVWVLGPKF